MPDVTACRQRRKDCLLHLDINQGDPVVLNNRSYSLAPPYGFVDRLNEVGILYLNASITFHLYRLSKTIPADMTRLSQYNITLQYVRSSEVCFNRYLLYDT
ncbi:hypothetical protein TNIN_342151 [Trichonephila inaurata madagascariensis]|uniref:Uncharacterized protein n=1 Tax=Trichonephila inaurata madagascariensis TaxID=2747483 RepID=A0A8X6WQ83_9ARAC|nr:hypothetical protein TNIN_342151 [Trichonephila inaurata madagascariensis]